MTSNNDGGAQLLADASAYIDTQDSTSEGFQAVMINAARAHLQDKLRALDPIERPADVQAAVDLVANAPSEAVQALLLELFAQGRLNAQTSR